MADCEVIQTPARSQPTGQTHGRSWHHATAPIGSDDQVPPFTSVSIVPIDLVLHRHRMPPRPHLQKVTALCTLLITPLMTPRAARHRAGVIGSFTALSRLPRRNRVALRGFLGQAQFAKSLDLSYHLLVPTRLVLDSMRARVGSFLFKEEPASPVLGFLSLAPMVRQERQTGFRFVADVLPRRGSVWTS